MGQEHVRRIPCSWWEPVPRARRWLRRYATGPCPGGARSYHNADVVLDEVAILADAHDLVSGDHWPHDDPRWPAVCASCGRPFEPGDAWQLMVRRLMHQVAPAAGGPELPVRDLPPGAMFDTDWMRDMERTGPDGIVLAVQLPGHEGRLWYPDGPPSGGGSPWQRTGDPRRPETLTIRPSILASAPPRFHAHLTAGGLDVLADSEC